MLPFSQNITEYVGNFNENRTKNQVNEIIKQLILLGTIRLSHLIEILRGLFHNDGKGSYIRVDFEAQIHCSP